MGGLGGLEIENMHMRMKEEESGSAEGSEDWESNHDGS